MCRPRWLRLRRPSSPRLIFHRWPRPGPKPSVLAASRSWTRRWTRMRRCWTWWRQGTTVWPTHGRSTLTFWTWGIAFRPRCPRTPTFSRRTGEEGEQDSRPGTITAIGITCPTRRPIRRHMVSLGFNCWVFGGWTDGRTINDVLIREITDLCGRLITDGGQGGPFMDCAIYIREYKRKMI